MSAASCGGGAVAAEYEALLGLGNVTEAKVRQVIRCDANLRKALRAAVAQLPGIVDAEASPSLKMAADLARGAYGPPSAEVSWATLSDAAKARVLKGADLPSNLRTWAQLSKRAAEDKIELLISTLISGEHNAEAAAQSAEQLAHVERQYARLSEAGRVKVTSKATTFGAAVVSWAELLRYAVARSEVAELAALVEQQLRKETAAAAKAPAATAAQDSPPGKPLPTKADAHRRRSPNHKARRTVAGKA